MVDYDLAGVLSGASFLVLGIFLSVLSFFEWPAIFYAILCLGIGIAIFVNLNNSDKIEPINFSSKDIKRN
jgi:hypothetical protein